MRKLLAQSNIQNIATLECGFIWDAKKHEGRDIFIGGALQ